MTERQWIISDHSACVMIVGQVNQECRKPVGGGWHDNVSCERVNCMIMGHVKLQELVT